MKFHEEGSDAVLPFPAEYHASSSIQNLLNAVKLIGWQAEQKTVTVIDSRDNETVQCSLAVRPLMLEDYVGSA